MQEFPNMTQTLAFYSPVASSYYPSVKRWTGENVSGLSCHSAELGCRREGCDGYKMDSAHERPQRYQTRQMRLASRIRLLRAVAPSGRSSITLSQTKRMRFIESSAPTISSRLHFHISYLFLCFLHFFVALFLAISRKLQQRYANVLSRYVTNINQNYLLMK